jgi:hypothetical protein
MQPGYCETEDEYHISKALLFHYLSSHEVLRLCGQNESISMEILNFISRHVLPHEDLYTFWRRNHIQHFDEFNNCSHEGTNFGIKTHAAAVLPGHSIRNAGKRLHLQAQLKYAELTKLAAAEFMSREVWSDLPSIDPLCKRAQVLILNEWGILSQV